MKKELVFELGSKDFLKSRDMFIKELTNIVKFSSKGCIVDSGFVYFLDVLVSNGDVNNTLFLYSCVLDLSCDKKTNSKIFSGIYDDILRLLMKDYSVGRDFFYDNKYGMIYNHLAFSITKHKR